MVSYKEISESIEKLIKSDQKARDLYKDLISKSNNKELNTNDIHPFITYVFNKLKIIFQEDIDPKEMKRGLIHFYSKNTLGIDVDIWK